MRRYLKKRRAVQKIDAYRQLPTLLREMDALAHRRAEQIAARTVLPLGPDWEKKLASIARETLTRDFPGLAQVIEANIPEPDKDAAYVYAMSRITEEILPVAEAAMREALTEIERHCARGIDEELDTLRALQQEGGKRGISSDPQ